MQHVRGLRALILMTILLLVVSTVGCTTADVHAVAASIGVTLDDTQAEAVAAHYSQPPAELASFVVAGYPGQTTAKQWAALRGCESGGNYQAISSSGRYRGAYQFDRSTWASYGPAGDPAAAPPAEQDARAHALYRDRGARPWPICGRHLR